MVAVPMGSDEAQYEWSPRTRPAMEAIVTCLSVLIRR